MAEATEYWRVPLTGHKFYLEDLPPYFEDSGTRIVQTEDDDGYALLIPVDASDESKERVLEYASRVLRIVEGTARTLGLAHGPLSADSTYYKVNSLGEKVGVIVEVPSPEIMIKTYAPLVSTGDDVRVENRKIMTEMVRLSQKHTAISDALTIFGRQDVTWAQLYVIYEIVRDDIGSEPHKRFLDVTEKEQDRFTRTACSYKVLGRDARHGPNNVQPPPKPMTYVQAKSLIGEILKAWIYEKTSNVPNV